MIRVCKTFFGFQNDGVSGGARGSDGGMARGEANTSKIQIPKFGIYYSLTYDESANERVALYKHPITSCQSRSEWVDVVLRSRLMAWDMMVTKDCDCSIEVLYTGPFSFKYVEVNVHDVSPINRRGGVIFTNSRLCIEWFLPLRTLRMACIRCSSLVHA